MPSWTEYLNQTGQGLVHGISGSNQGNYFSMNRGRISSWKKSLDSTGSGLLKGLVGKTAKGYDGYEEPLNLSYRRGPNNGLDLPSPVGSENLSYSMVHGIRCFDLPVRSHIDIPEVSLIDRIKGNISLRDRKYLQISSPIPLTSDEEEIEYKSPTPPKPNDENPFKSPLPEVTQSPIRVEFFPSGDGFVVGEKSPPENLSDSVEYIHKSHHLPVSPRPLLPSTTGSETPDDDDSITWSDSSSIYSQESAGAGYDYGQYSFPR